LQTYSQIQHHAAGHHGSELAALLHRDEHVDRAQRRLLDFVKDLIDEAAQAGDLRDDLEAGELAAYCLHALTAAGTLSTLNAVHRLVAVTLAGLRSAPPASHHR
jgi:hypothetical protein